MRFASPIFLLLCIPLAAGVWFFLFRTRRERAALIFSNIDEIKKIPSSIGVLIYPYLQWIKILGIVLVIIALSRPQKGQRTEELLTRGIDIILCFDTSTSMRAEDFKPLNRLEAAQQAGREFVRGRKYDRIGVVVFSAMAFTQCPLTLDYGAVLDFLDSVQIGITQTDGTAIGTALTTCVNRLRNSTAKSKVIILLTDGRNNMGDVDPVTAAKTAEALGIKIYTIGAGKIGPAPYPVDDPLFGRRYVLVNEDLDEPTLKEIAQFTDGLYFRATSSEMLKSIYKKIDELEKTEIKIKEYTDYHELYPYILIAACAIYIIVLMADALYFRRIP